MKQPLVKKRMCIADIVKTLPGIDIFSFQTPLPCISCLCIQDKLIDANPNHGNNVLIFVF